MPELVPVVTVIMIFAIPIVGIITQALRVAWKAWLDASLKRDMVARGYTAQEIIDVVSLSSGDKAKSALAAVPPAKPVKQPVYN